MVILIEIETLNTGFQLNHMIKTFLPGDKVMTLGVDYLYDSVFDRIPNIII